MLRSWYEELKMFQVNTRLLSDFFQRKFISALKLSFVYVLFVLNYFEKKKNFDAEIFATVSSWTWSRIKSCRYVTLLLIFLSVLHDYISRKLFIINLLEAICASATQIGKIIYLQMYGIVMATLAKRKRTKASIMVFSSISKWSKQFR